MEETIFEMMNAEAIATALGAKWNRIGTKFRRTLFDSRRASDGDLFFALKGERFDGHDFLDQVFEQGCRGVVVDRKRDIRTAMNVPDGTAIFEVDDVLTAFGCLAHEILGLRRNMGDFAVYAITGSNGKTTTKEILATLLEAKGKCVLKTEGNLNNFIGLPMNVVQLTPKHDVAVLEMGANAPGEIAHLRHIAPPDIAIITCVGAAHLGGFGSIEGVARAKGELLEAPDLDKIVLPCATRSYYADIANANKITWVGTSAEDSSTYIDDIEADSEGIRFKYHGDGTKVHDIALPLLGAHNAMNLALALTAVGGAWTDDAINSALLNVKLPSGRLERWHTAPGIVILHDAYNANPLSMHEALRLVATISKSQNRCLILGEMRELGDTSDECHRTLGREVATCGFKKLVCIGPSAHCISAGALAAGASPCDIFCAPKDELQSAIDWLRPQLATGDICLIKGSRGMELERALSMLGAEIG